MSADECEELGWEQHTTLEAIDDAMREHQYLRTLRHEMRLPEEVLDFLYWNDVDTLADLMQITEEELASIARDYGIDTSPVRKYLEWYGLELCHCDGRTYKVRTLTLIKNPEHPVWETWEIHAPGAMPEFNVERPALNARWFEEYYKRYGTIVNDDLFFNEFLSVWPDILKEGVHNDYQSFFQNVYDFKTSYLAICEEHNLEPRVTLPDLPRNVVELYSFSNDSFCFVWKDCLRAVIDILERTDLMKNSSPGKFLTASDEQKLYIAQGEQDSGLGEFLINLVGVMVDYENVDITLYDLFMNHGKTALRQTAGSKKEGRPYPINPWLAEVILNYRQTHSDDSLKAEYRRCLEQAPDKSWEDFLACTALGEEMKRNPVLATRRKDMALPLRTRRFLNANNIDTLADLLQLTEKEITSIFASRTKDLRAVRDYLGKMNLSLYDSEVFTRKFLTVMMQDGDDRLKLILQRAVKDAEEMVVKAYGSEEWPEEATEELRDGLLQAMDLLNEAVRLAEEADCDVRVHERVLKSYLNLLGNHMALFPGLKDIVQGIEQKYKSLMDDAFGDGVQK